MGQSSSKTAASKASTKHRNSRRAPSPKGSSSTSSATPETKRTHLQSPFIQQHVGGDGEEDANQRDGLGAKEVPFSGLGSDGDGRAEVEESLGEKSELGPGKGELETGPAEMDDEETKAKREKSKALHKRWHGLQQGFRKLEQKEELADDLFNKTTTTRDFHPFELDFMIDTIESGRVAREELRKKKKELEELKREIESLNAMS